MRGRHASAQVNASITFVTRSGPSPRPASADDRGIVRLLDLEPYLNRKPKHLSGGQRQRVAMGRAIVRRPEVFLMDEPLSNLDAKLRAQTRNQIAALQRRLGTTTIYVTHDQVEAMTMGDRVAVLCDGVLRQCAAPRELYRRPANVFVARCRRPRCRRRDSPRAPRGERLWSRDRGRWWLASTVSTRRVAVVAFGCGPHQSTSTSSAPTACRSVSVRRWRRWRGPC